MTAKDRQTAAFPVGIGIGIAVGAAVGVAIREPAIGAGIAIALGLVFGMLLRVMKVMGNGGDDARDS